MRQHSPHIRPDAITKLKGLGWKYQIAPANGGPTFRLQAARLPAAIAELYPFGMNIEIRTAVPEDRDEWTRLRFELWPDCPPERHELEVTQVLAGAGIVALAFVDDELAGFAEVSVRSDHVEGTACSPVAYLEGWFVRPAHRGRGVGRALIAFAERWAISKGFSELASDAELENSRSTALHVALGFREVGRNVHFVKNLKEKAEQTRCSEPGGVALVDNRNSAAPGR